MKSPDHFAVMKDQTRNMKRRKARQLRDIDELTALVIGLGFTLIVVASALAVNLGFF